MEGKHQKENRLYCEELSGEARERYLEKVECVEWWDSHERVDQCLRPTYLLTGCLNWFPNGTSEFS